MTTATQVQSDPNDPYSVFRSLETESRPSETTTTVQAQSPSVSIDQLPVDPTDKYSIFRSFEGTSQTVSNPPLSQSQPQGLQPLLPTVSAAGSSLVTESLALHASGGLSTGMVDISSFSAQHQIDQDFGAFSEFQSAAGPSVSLSQPQPVVTDGGFADFQSATVAVSSATQSQSQISSDSVFTAFQSTVQVVGPEVQTESQLSRDAGFSAFESMVPAVPQTQLSDTEFSSFQSTVPAVATQPLVSSDSEFFGFQSAVPAVISQPQVSSDIGLSGFQAPAPVVHLGIQPQSQATSYREIGHLTAGESAHQEQPVLNKVANGRDFSDSQVPETSGILPSDLVTSHTPGDNPMSTTAGHDPNSEVANRKTLLALAMDSQRDESPGPLLVVATDMPGSGLAEEEQPPEIDLLGGDLPLAASVTQVSAQTTTKDDSFGEFSGASVASSKPEFGLLSVEAPVSSMSAADFSASSSSSSSLSKMNIMSGNWSDLASLADLGVSVSAKPVNSSSNNDPPTASENSAQSALMMIQTGRDLDKDVNEGASSNQPGNQASDTLPKLEGLSWTSNNQKVIYPQTALFGAQYDRLDSAEAVSIV